MAAVHPTVTTSLVSLHVAAYREGLAASGVGALERLLARVAMGVNLQAGRTAKGLVARRADISIL